LPLNRRTFLGAGAAALATSAWGTRAAGQQRRLDRIGLQLYTLRTQLAKDLAGTLAKVAEIGFREVEFAGYYEHSPAQIRQLLQDNGLTAPAAHTLIGPLATDTQRLIDECAEIGHRYLVMAYLLPNQRSLDQYARHIEVLNSAGEKCRAAGIRLAYHNHDFEFESHDGTVPYDLLLDGVSPELMTMELDLYWIQKGGADPLAYFERAPGRFELFHVKDMHRSSGSFTEVGSGSVPFAKIFAQSELAGTKHYFVEQDIISGDPYESLSKSFAFLRDLRF
jgi:sugar phosphate isomerase/epimerase